MSINIRTSFFGKMLQCLLIGAFTLSAGIVMAAGTHDVRTANNDAFELEGNSVPNEWNPPNELDDFDEVYRDIANILHPNPEAAETAGGGLLSPGVDTEAFIEVFQWDDFRDLSPAAGGFAGSTTFLTDPTTAGPGMKDVNPIADWHCVASNNLGPKFDLRQTYLAFYKEDHAQPNDHLVMFGGGVRDSNNGSAAIGFWLFRTEVACQSDPNLPNFERFVKPDGSIAEHVDGDILLVSDFTAGGRVAEIHAWRWMGDDATGAPAQLILPSGQVFGDCKDDETTTPDEMIMCGTVNAANISPITLEWDPRSTLSGSVANQLQTGQYFEGGVDLTELTGVGVESCVNSFILETRASASLEAKLHDFVGGSLSTCGTIIVRKFTDPTGDATPFTFNVTGYDPFQLADTEEEIISSVLPGTYAVSEDSPPTGWTLDNAECGLDTDGDKDADSGFFDPRVADVEVGLNEVYVCTFYNVKEATLTLEKTVINDNGGTLTEDDFPRYIDGNPVSWDTPYAFTPGSSGEVHVASEDAQAGYTASAWGGDCAADGSVTLYPGDNKTCTITNNDDPPALLLWKDLINNNGGTAVESDWTLCAGGNCVPGSVTPTLATDQAGTYDLSENTVPGYTNTSVSCDNGDGPGSVTIGLGETVTCVFVNDDDPPALLLWKDLINNNGGTAVESDWTLCAGGNCVPGSVTPTLATDQAGTYDLSENTVPGYTNTSVSCDNGDGPGSVTIGLGETVTCVFVNDDIPPALLLQKLVSNNNGGTAVPSDWTLCADGNCVPGSETPQLASVIAGTYALTESSVAHYTNTSITCDDAPGVEVTSVTIWLGETKTCTFVNDDDPPSLLLRKLVDNGSNPGGSAVSSDWTLCADGNCVPGSETAIEATDQAGTYALTESSVAGYLNTSITCDDAPGEVTSVTIGIGEIKTCTFVNIAMGMAELYKLTDGIETTGTWNFSLFGPGVDATAFTPPALLNFGGVKLIPGETYTMCELGIPSGVIAVWTHDVNGNGAIDIPPDVELPFVGAMTGNLWEVYNPDAGIPEDYGNRCVDFQAGIGETVSFIIDNQVPKGDARTPGYWKNWSSCSSGNQFDKAAGEFFDGEDPRHITLDEILPQTIGALFLNGDTTGGTVYDGSNNAMCEEAVLVLQSSEQVGKHKVLSSDAAYKLARSLLAYYANKSPVQPAYDCPVAAQAAVDAQALLLGVGYIGVGDYLSPKGKVSPEMQALIDEALYLNGILDDYNNNDIMNCSVTP